jgi:hypothetical protein
MSFDRPDPRSEHRDLPGDFAAEDAVVSRAALRDRIRAWIPEALAGELEPELQELVERHVAQDLELAREWHAQRRARLALQSLAEGEEGDPGLDDVFFEDLHRGIVHAIHEDERLAHDLETLDRYPSPEPGLRRVFRAGLGHRAWSSLGRGLADRLRGLHAPRYASRVALAAACLFLGLLIGRFLEGDGVLVTLPSGAELLEEGPAVPAGAIPVSNADRLLQQDLLRVYTKIKALPAPEREALPVAMPALAPSLAPEAPVGTDRDAALASAEAGVDL